MLKTLSVDQKINLRQLFAGYKVKNLSNFKTTEDYQLILQAITGLTVRQYFKGYSWA